MYKKIAAASFFISMLSPLLVLSQGSEAKQLSPFTSIDVTKRGKVIVTQGDSYTIRTEPADKSDKVNATVNGKTLSIDAPEVIVYVTMKEMEELSISGWGSIACESPVKSEGLKLSIGGSGKMEIKDADLKKLNIDISGLGKVTIAGKAETADMNISGSGKVDASGLKTMNCDASISGLGKCNVDVTDNLNVNISGSGSVNYVNPPKNISKNISGIGKVRESSEAGEGGNDTTSVRVGNTKITIADADNEDNDNGKDYDNDWEHKWDDWGDRWEHFPFTEKHKHSNRNKPSWPGIEIGVNGYLDAGGSSTLPPGLNYLDLDYGKSTSFSINFFDARKSLCSRHLFVFTGLGITWNAYKFSNNITLEPSSSNVTASFDSINYTKDKLAATYLMAPAMIEYFFGHNRYKSFHVAAGMMLGYKLGSHTKQKYESDIGTVKTKVYDNFNLNPFRASVRVSAGYGRVSIFAEQGLTTFFEKNKGPVLYPFTAGIAISSF